MGIGGRMILQKVNHEQKKSSFHAKINLEIKTGRFLIKTISSQEELNIAFALRYQVFQVEMIGSDILIGEDHDDYDHCADHLAIYDTKSNQMIATCRLNCSLFSNTFYSEQEFHCAPLIQRPETKVEIGRVCVHQDFRRGIIIMLLWKALAQYMSETESRFLFGCGSVSTLNPKDAVILYRYLESEGKINNTFNITPTEKYKSAEFERILLDNMGPLTPEKHSLAKSLLPSLCRSYFEMGCFSPGAPAFDSDFKCIDFLTILDMNNLSLQMQRKMMGAS
jgi:putative hemolysin